MWDNRIFDQAFDHAGMRQQVRRLIDGIVVGEFNARFDRPQMFVLDGMAHTTDYSLEYTTTDVSPALSFHDEVEIEVSRGVWERYRVNQIPLVQGDGHWTRLELEKL